MKLFSRQSGFTLIELLVAISIIGVLAAVLLANMVGVRERGADAKLKNDLNQLKTALRLYYNDNQGYPAGDNTCIAVLGEPFEAADGTPYMNELPEGCEYESADSDAFVIYVPLNNDGDPAGDESATKCGQATGQGRYYVCAD